jgi:hypothetical protein
MVSTGNFSVSYAKALAIGSPDDQRTADAPKKTKPDSILKMESELLALEKEFCTRDRSYGRDVLNLTVLQAYLKKLLSNSKVSRYLAQNHAEYFAEFRTILEAASLEG